MNDESRIQRAKSSFKIPFSETIAPQALYQQVLKKIASNVKMGPFTATSGVILPYYLNASTNFLDKSAAPLIVELLAHYLTKNIKTTLSPDNFANGGRVLCVGMEVAGGMIACQLASMRNSPLESWMDFVYVRKSRKTSGTCQQLEGPQIFTSRTPESPALNAIWVDDALSTGTSMLEGIQMLKKDYNIHVVCALYLVDRSRDRQNLSHEKQKLAHPDFDNVNLRAIYDLEEIDAVVPKK